jgi:hypothetical protein
MNKSASALATLSCIPYEDYRTHLILMSYPPVLTQAQEYQDSPELPPALSALESEFSTTYSPYFPSCTSTNPPPPRLRDQALAHVHRHRPQVIEISFEEAIRIREVSPRPDDMTDSSPALTHPPKPANRAPRLAIKLESLHTSARCPPTQKRQSLHQQANTLSLVMTHSHRNSAPAPAAAQPPASSNATATSAPCPPTARRRCGPPPRAPAPPPRAPAPSRRPGARR